MFKNFTEGLAKRLGERAADVLWIAGVGTVTFLGWWLTGPDKYTLTLTRWSIALAVLMSAALLASAVLATRRIYRATTRRFHLTAVTHQNVWGTSTPLADGTRNTQINTDLIVKNMTDGPLYLVAARLVRPLIRGPVLASSIHVRGESGPIPPRETRQITAMLLMSGTPKQTCCDLNAVLAVADDEGHEQLVRIYLHGPPAPARANP